MKTKFFLSLFIIATILISSLAFSAGLPAEEKWKYFASNSKGEGFFYDTESIIRSSKDIILVWVKSIGHDSSVTRALEEINCSFRIVRDRQVIHEVQNKAPRITNTISDWRPIEEDPVFVELSKTLCR